MITLQDTYTLALVNDNMHENAALYLNDKMIVDYDDYVNLETAAYTLKALDINFITEIYSFNSDQLDEWNGFAPTLTEVKQYAKLDKTIEQLV